MFKTACGPVFNHLNVLRYAFKYALSWISYHSVLATYTAFQIWGSFDASGKFIINWGNTIVFFFCTQSIIKPVGLCKNKTKHNYKAENKAIFLKQVWRKLTI